MQAHGDNAYILPDMSGAPLFETCLMKPLGTFKYYVINNDKWSYNPIFLKDSLVAGWC